MMDRAQCRNCCGTGSVFDSQGQVYRACGRCDGDGFLSPPKVIGDEFSALRRANLARHLEWAKGNPLPLTFRATELAGEAGEVCNAIKKVERTRLGLVGGTRDLSNLREELADVIICVDLIAMDLGIDLWPDVIAKFNKTSEKNGLQTRLAPPAKS